MLTEDAAMGMDGAGRRVQAADARAAVVAAAKTYFAERRARVEPFVKRNFSLAGSARLHQAALGRDLVRAPANIALAPVHVAMRLTAVGARIVKARHVSDWLRTRQILLRTDVAAEVERLVVTDLLELPWGGQGTRSGRDALAETILSSPEVNALVAAGGGVRTAASLDQRLCDNLSEYGGARAAIAEITTSIAVLGAGMATFQKLTPGMISLGPLVAAALVHSTAVAAFPLGSGAGSFWYWLFPAEVSPVLAVGTTGGLIAVGAVAAAFAGVLADPLQSRLGLHQHRLHRLIDALESEFIDGKGAGFAAREHYVARVIDFADAVFLALRQLRA